MSETKIGIGDIGIYVPAPKMELDRLMQSRSKTHPELKSKLKRALDKTGQTAFRFPQPWEDTASLAANAAADALDRLPDSGASALRYMAVGTETSVDHSKAAASYVQGMLQRAGYPLPMSMSTFETKHACAGGTAALLSTAAMLGFSGREGERALAINSDIARYDAPSTAEITQGSGAVALVVERNPRLLELNLGRQGFFSSDVDDFYRPLGSVTAKVKGWYSVECYEKALQEAFLDYCSRADETPRRAIADIDYAALHVPFPRMPETAVRKMLGNLCGYDEQGIDDFMKRTALLDAMYMSREFGNIYTGSLYVYLAALLVQEHAKLGDGIAGRKILLASYGSGNTMIVYTAVITPDAPRVIASWDLDGLRGNAHRADFDEYLSWLARPKNPTGWRILLQGAKPSPGMFYLKDFDENGLRIYGRG